MLNIAARWGRIIIRDKTASGVQDNCTCIISGKRTTDLLGQFKVFCKNVERPRSVPESAKKPQKPKPPMEALKEF